MDIEKEIFAKAQLREDKLIPYGFKKEKETYIYRQELIPNFDVIISITPNTIPSGQVIDKISNEEYKNFKLVNTFGTFNATIRTAYIELLTDIKNKCYNVTNFYSPQANRIAEKISEIYKVKPEFMWEKYAGFAVFRDKNSEKWFAIIMNINAKKLGLDLDEEVNIINVKLDEDLIDMLVKENGYFRAYHMNKRKWITLILNDTLSDEIIMKYIAISFELIK